MTKQDAMDEFGCDTLTQLADKLGVTLSAVSQWTEPLPEHAERRVHAALFAKKLSRRKKK